MSAAVPAERAAVRDASVVCVPVTTVAVIKTSVKIADPIRAMIVAALRVVLAVAMINSAWSTPVVSVAMSVEAIRPAVVAVIPGPGANEYAANKPVRPVITVR